MWIYNVIIEALWVIMMAVWFVGLFTRKRTARRGWYGLGIRAFMVLIVIGVAYFGARHGANKQELTGVIMSPALGVLGIALTAAGVAVAIWARLTLGRNWGMPMSLRQDHQLVESGPYQYVRHPIYAGVLLAMLGSACVNWWWAIFTFFFAFYFIYSALREEKDMQAQFPEYAAYKARTWRLIPFVF